jgi:uncharacterized glyoxalase superfamily protein PhnB
MGSDLAQNTCTSECERPSVHITAIVDGGYFACLEVDDIDPLHEAVMEKGAMMIKELRNEPWGMREFGIRTVGGHRIMFGCPVVEVV